MVVEDEQRVLVEEVAVLIVLVVELLPHVLVGYENAVSDGDALQLDLVADRKQRIAVEDGLRRVGHVHARIGLPSDEEVSPLVIREVVCAKEGLQCLVIVRSSAHVIEGWLSAGIGRVGEPNSNWRFKEEQVGVLIPGLAVYGPFALPVVQHLRSEFLK